MQNEFEYTDKVIKMLNRKLIRAFDGFKTGLKFDELNVLKGVNEQYERMASEMQRQYRHIARRKYSDTWEYLIALGLAKGKMPGEKAINATADAVVKQTLGGYNPVTEYVFSHEIERKSARTAEAIIAAQIVGDRNKAIDKSLKLLSNQMAEYADYVTLESAKAAYGDAGVKRVIWRTRHDEKRCQICKGLDGNVYNLDSAPDKPHYNCRCWLEPYTGRAKD